MPCEGHDMNVIAWTGVRNMMAQDVQTKPKRQSFDILSGSRHGNSQEKNNHGSH